MNIRPSRLTLLLTAVGGAAAALVATALDRRRRKTRVRPLEPAPRRPDEAAESTTAEQTSPARSFRPGRTPWAAPGLPVSAGAGPSRTVRPVRMHYHHHGDR